MHVGVASLSSFCVVRQLLYFPDRLGVLEGKVPRDVGGCAVADWQLPTYDLLVD